MASLDGLRIHLYGCDSLQDRLHFAEKAFLAPLNVPAINKEDVVIKWLSQLLTDKAITLSSEDLVAAWRTMNTLLSSRRLKALCKNSWLCPLSSSFIETVVDVINSGLEDIVREGAIKVCHTMVSNPTLAPLVTHSSEHCLFLTKGLIKWLLEGHKSDLDVTLTLMMTVEVSSHLRSQPKRNWAMTAVIDHLLLLAARLVVVFLDDDRELVQKLLKEVKMVISTNLFQNELIAMYRDTLSTLLSEETKAVLSSEVDKLLVLILSAIENELVEVSQCLLKEFLNEFLLRFKGHGALHYQIVIVLCHMLDVSIPSPKIPCIEKNSLAAQKLKPSKLDKGKQEALLYSILYVVESSSLDLMANVSGVNFSTWLESLGEMLTSTSPESTHGYKCLRILLAVIPEFMSNCILIRLCDICCYNNVHDIAASKDALYSAYDDLLCEILEVFIKLRNITEMLGKIVFGLNENSASLDNQQIIPDSLLVYEGKLLFPPRFMLSMMRAVSNLGQMGHKQVLQVWELMLYFLTKDCSKLLRAPGKPGDIQFVSMVVWLFSCIMKASPTMLTVSLVGVAPTFANIMNRMAIYGIKPLIPAMLTQPHNNNVCGSILVMCYTWGEIHTNLLSTDLGYSEWPDLPIVQSPNLSQPTDFSYLLPFILPDAWAQISARVANFGNQPTQLALVQLVIQKLSLAALEQQKNIVCQDSVSDQPIPAAVRQTMESVVKYLMNAMDTWGSNMSHLMVVHLAYILPFIHNNHLPALSRYLVSGIREGETAWQEYVKSHHFHEASRLHPYILSTICSTLVMKSSSSKRKISEIETCPTTDKNYCIKLLKKMARIAPLLQEFDLIKEEENAMWEILQECGDILRKLIENANTSNRNIDNTSDLDGMIDLLGSFPLSCLNEGFQTAVLLVLFALLVQEGPERKKPNFSLLHLINLALCSQCRFRLFRVTNASSLLLWLIRWRLTLPFSLIMQHMVNLDKIVLKKKTGQYPVELLVDQTISGSTSEALTSNRFDHLLSSLFFKLTSANSNGNHIKALGEFITASPEATTDAELFLQPAVFLMAACYKKFGASCKWTMRRLTTWTLQQMKKMDLAKIAPASAAAILTAHTIIVLTKTSCRARKKNVNNDSKNVDSTTEEASKNLTENSEELKKEVESCEPQEKTQKTHKWQKLLGCSFKLAELCLSSGHPELEKYALTFLSTVSQHSDSLQSFLPSHFLNTMWTALSDPSRSLAGINCDLFQSFKLALEPFLLTASPDDYEKLLQDLLRRTNMSGPDLTHTLMLWRLVIASKVFGANGTLKRFALGHLISMLVNITNSYHTTGECDSSYLIPVLETLKELMNTHLRFGAQSRAIVLSPCSTIHLQSLPVSEFSKVFTLVADIVNCIVVHHSIVVMERTPSVLAAITHLTTSLIAQANQDHKLKDDQIKIMVECGNQVERVVRKLNPYSVKLIRVVHFTVATIVGDLQRATVYPAVKVILENIIYRLLDLCESHCLNHLLVSLPAATTTLFKHLHNNYKTFHRFNPMKA
ncbi:uncharacterized protein [Panulirus ornatus]|uniref:uncharacterized protein n=1 Tax=Panulirus ornatus TaxID=150431 RepID=UPI003A8452CF